MSKAQIMQADYAQYRDYCRLFGTQPVSYQRWLERYEGDYAWIDKGSK